MSTLVDDLRAALGDGPAAIVRPTEPSSMAVWVGAELVNLEPADQQITISTWQHCAPVRRYGTDSVHPRIDLIVIRVFAGEVHAKALAGVPTPSPIAPACPADWLPIATVHVAPSAAAVNHGDITEVRP